MTSEQIAELRDAIERLRSGTLPLKPVPPEVVWRLLNERELLLIALRRVLDRTTSDEELTKRVSYARSLLVAVEGP